MPELYKDFLETIKPPPPVVEMLRLGISVKHCWRVLHNPNSLGARIIKEKQYTTIGRAHGQIGIYCLKWIIGNGVSIKLWKDKWLPTPTFLAVQSPRKILVKMQH